MSLCGQKSMNMIPRLMLFPDRSWLSKVWAAWGGMSHIKEPLRGRLNSVNEMNALPRQVMALYGPGGMSHIKEPIRGRLNSVNEMNALPRQVVAL